MLHKLSEYTSEISLFFKKMFYAILSEENLEKIIKRKDEKIEDLKFLENLELQKIKDDLEDEGYLTDEEMAAIVYGEEKESHAHRELPESNQ